VIYHLPVALREKTVGAVVAATGKGVLTTSSPGEFRKVIIPRLSREKLLRRGDAGIQQ
jgi:hypothetical protein